ncbi:MAG: ATP-dependent DNA helicase [Anaerolineae bacterium]
MSQTIPDPPEEIEESSLAGSDYERALVLLADLRERSGTPDESLQLWRLAVAAAASAMARRGERAETVSGMVATLSLARADQLIQTSRDLFKQANSRAWRGVILLAEALALRARVLRLPIAIAEAPARREQAIGFALSQAQRALKRRQYQRVLNILRDLLTLAPDNLEAQALLDTLAQAAEAQAQPPRRREPALTLREEDDGALITPPLAIWDEIALPDAEPEAERTPTPWHEVDLRQVLGPGGPVARYLGDRYYFRPGQLQMAETVMQAMRSAGHALIEAGTGSGKSFAYLVPAIWSGQKVLVATANKLLQDQLWLKDIPALQQVAPRPFKAALLKGRSNYICNRKLDQMAKRPTAEHQNAGFSAARFIEWAQSDSGEMDALNLSERLRPHLTIENHECLGNRCPLIRLCFYERAKRRLDQADVAVVNHSLLALDLNSEAPFFTMPDVVVVDEAHELASYTATALQLTLTYGKMQGIINSNHVNYYLAGALRGQLQSDNNTLFADLTENAPREAFGRWELTGAQPEMARMALHLQEAAKAMQAIKAPYGSEEMNAEFRRFVEHLALSQFELQMMAAEVPAGRVRFVERMNAGDPRSLFVIQRPLEVSDFLAEHLFDKVKTVICTSATLRTSDGYEFFRRQVGAPTDCVTLDVPSPFDYFNNVLIYTAPHLTPPDRNGDEETYQLELAREVYRLITYSGGRALILCTSLARMRYLYDTVSPHVKFPLLRQGDAPRAELIRQFQAAGNAVLFATRSFWQGIDIPGEALSLVVIDRLPFPVPSDPVVAGRDRLLRASGGEPFSQLMLPEATLALKQGVGRLMRSESDRGVIALLDSRLLHKFYGRSVLAALPPGRVTSDRLDVKRFFDAG